MAQRQRSQDIPDTFVVVTVGADRWIRAKAWRESPNDTPAMVLPYASPESFRWPVRCCLVVIEVGGGLSSELIECLAACLFQAGALGVAVMTSEDNDIVIFILSGASHAAT